MGASVPSRAADEEASTSGSNDSGRNVRRAVLDATAGAVAGCVQRLVVAPLDVIKIRFQVQIEPVGKALQQGAAAAAAAVPGRSKYTSIWQAANTIVKEEGIQALWRGTLPGQLLAIPYTAVQFITLQQCKLEAKRRGWTDNHRVAPLVSFGSGALSGVAGTVASYPFDLLRTMLAAQGEPRVFNSMGDAARGIMSQRGVIGLYSGLQVTLLEIIPYAALQFGLYDAFNKHWDTARHSAALQGRRKRARQAGQAQLAGDEVQVDAGAASSWQQFVCGLAAGTVAKLATHPLDVVKKRYQVAGLQRSLRYGERVSSASVTSIRTCVSQIYAREGVAGFYKGVVPSLLKAAPAAAVTLTTYEFLIWYLAGKTAAQASVAAQAKASGAAASGAGAKLGSAPPSAATMEEGRL